MEQPYFRMSYRDRLTAIQISKFYDSDDLRALGMTLFREVRLRMEPSGDSVRINLERNVYGTFDGQAAEMAGMVLQAANPQASPPSA